ncbi:hypothetical protein GH714_012214 [Hevea brasiliensis]|uniref:Uncharacterized protein n=1 Tax=Hevea brasiliensis TaxID=3981 RepID=A0A6A6N328_HEVBR|nr:hypothetical protein GH714_012214 [Hevea brasiliensis]
MLVLRPPKKLLGIRDIFLFLVLRCELEEEQDYSVNTYGPKKLSGMWKKLEKSDVHVYGVSQGEYEPMPHGLHWWVSSVMKPEDAVFHFTQSVSNSLRLPRIVLRTGGASSFLIFSAFPFLRKKGHLPIQESQLEEPVVEFPPLKVKDLPVINTMPPRITLSI